MPLPTLALSDLVEIQHTPSSGRAVFAKQHIPQGTKLLVSSSPATWTIFREYRREVCTECFGYNRGVQWKLRDTKEATGTGAVWCSEACRQQWLHRWRDPFTSEINGNDGSSLAIEAFAALERFVSSARAWNNGEWDVAMLDVAAERPSEAEVRQSWENAKLGEQAIRDVRMASIDGIRAIKTNRKVMQATLAEPPAPDILSYLLSAIHVSYLYPEEWRRFCDVVAAPEPYPSHSRLNQHILAFYQLLAILPVRLLQYVTPEICIAASDRDTHNSFGLRSLDDSGCEMFGFGVWPTASYWNHSCSPNVRKQRIGRSWDFETSEDVEKGEQLCITYLGGEEEELDLAERRRRLKDVWAFTCMCARCIDEECRNGT